MEEKRKNRKRDGPYWYEMLEEEEMLDISRNILEDIDRKARL